MSTAVIAVSDISRSDLKCLRYIADTSRDRAAGSVTPPDYRYRYALPAFVAARSASPDVDTITAGTATGTETGDPEIVFPGA